MRSGRVVDAEIMTAGGLSSRWQQLPPNSIVTLRYEVDGKTYDQVGYLKGRTEFIQVHSKVPVRIDPSNPDQWTARTEPASLLQELTGALVVLPAFVALAVVSLVQRSRMARVWRDGEARRAIVVESRQTALAHRARGSCAARPPTPGTTAWYRSTSPPARGRSARRRRAVAPVPARRAQQAGGGGVVRAGRARMTEPTTSASPPAAVNSASPVVALAPGALDVKHQSSVWSTRDKVRRVAWMVVRTTLFRPSFHNWYGWRRFVLRLMGAKVGAGVRVRETAHIEIPWNLEIGDDTVVGHEAILYSLGKIRLGRKVTISQYAHLCAGTHDPSDPTFPLLTPPVTVEDGAWVATERVCRARRDGGGVGGGGGAVDGGEGRARGADLGGKPGQIHQAARDEGVTRPPPTWSDLAMVLWRR